MASGLMRPAGTLDAGTALLPYRGSWNDRLAAHLLRRAGFGGTPPEIARYAAMTPHDAVESLLHFPDTSALPQPEVMPLPVPPITKDVRKAAAASVATLRAWWLNRMLATPAPLQEKMTLFLHGHFTTAAIEKGVWPSYIFAQNQLYRSNALGNLRSLTMAVSKDPAMLLYLDNAGSSKAHPNENYARELMELFTLGRGNYGEEDVRESARAFTGWTVNRRTGEALFVPRRHDDGVKNFLGQTGNFNGDDIVGIIYRQPACARFWSNALLNAFVYNDPEPELIDAFAQVIARNDFELAPSLSRLFQSNVFFSSRAYRGTVKSPAEFIVGTHKTFGLARIEPRSVRAMAAMGQILFRPPNVAGWPGGANWLTSQTLIARENFVVNFLRAPVMAQSDWFGRVSTRPNDADAAAHALTYAILQDDVPSEAVAHVVDYLRSSSDVPGTAYLAMATPGYQLA